MHVRRRDFLKYTLGTLATGALFYPAFFKLPKKIPGRLMGPSAALGHRLRDGGAFPEPSRFEETEIAIVGGGMSGLSAGWRLQKKGFQNFKILELEPEVGGNARSGKNEVSAYPWGAHYVPLPGDDSHFVRALFEDLGIITGYDEKGVPIYNEYYLCAYPQERLYIHGLWQEGLVPQVGITPSDQKQYESFFKKMDFYRLARGKDGKRAFTIPLELSSRDPEFLKFDQISMKDFMNQNGWNSPQLHWYVNYCCRDDYGTLSSEVSAWAGIHYFASRNGRAANDPDGSVLTWPEGNGWIAHQLRDRLQDHIETQRFVFRVASDQDGSIVIDAFDSTQNASIRTKAKSVVMATPRFIAQRILPGSKKWNGFTYAPWMVANITLSELPPETKVPLSWDNVIHESDSLGYVDATHQSLSSHPQKTVLTYYQPLTSQDPQSERTRAISKDFSQWKTEILADLNQAHPAIDQIIENIDVWVWGHAMIRPTTGFMWGEERKVSHEPMGKIFFAHSDMSGISIFEEAQYWGVTAADQALRSISTRLG